MAMNVQNEMAKEGTSEDLMTALQISMTRSISLSQMSGLCAAIQVSHKVSWKTDLCAEDTLQEGRLSLMSGCSA